MQFDVIFFSEKTPSTAALNLNSAASLDLRYAPTVPVLPTGPQIFLRSQHNTGNNNNGQLQIGANTGAMPKSQSWTANLNRNQAGGQRSTLPKSATMDYLMLRLKKSSLEAVAVIPLSLCRPKSYMKTVKGHNLLICSCTYFLAYLLAGDLH